MQCPHCGDDRSKVRYVRQQSKQGFIWRQRECSNGHTFSTTEIPGTLGKKLAPVKDMKRLADRISAKADEILSAT